MSESKITLTSFLKLSSCLTYPFILWVYTVGLYWCSQHLLVHSYPQGGCLLWGGRESYCVFKLTVETIFVICRCSKGRCICIDDKDVALVGFHLEHWYVITDSKPVPKMRGSSGALPTAAISSPAPEIKKDRCVQNQHAWTQTTVLQFSCRKARPSQNANFAR